MVGTHVLIVDDDDVIRSSLTMAIKEKIPGVMVTHAADPIQASNELHSNRNTLTHVVVDYFMPVENGLEFCKMVKRDSPDIKVILFSGNSELKNSRELIHVDKFFMKPSGRDLVNWLAEHKVK